MFGPGRHTILEIPPDYIDDFFKNAVQNTVSAN